MGFSLRKEKDGTPQKAKTVEIHNPYLAARREWDERYGEFITRARNWRTVAMISAFAPCSRPEGWCGYPPSRTLYLSSF